MRLIDADALKIDYGFTWDDITPTHEEMYALIDRQPTIEERKVGHWIVEEIHSNWDDRTNCTCPICGKKFTVFDPSNFCPNCGARMEKNK